MYSNVGPCYCNSALFVSLIAIVSRHRFHCIGILFVHFSGQFDPQCSNLGRRTSPHTAGVHLAHGWPAQVPLGLCSDLCGSALPAGRRNGLVTPTYISTSPCE